MAVKLTSKHPKRRIALVCLTPDIGAIGSPHELPSYGIRRIQAALLADPAVADCEVALIDSRDHDISADAAGTARFAEVVEAFDPDIVGFSVYLWSFPVLLEVARRLKQKRPQRIVVFGGPSARPVMFSLEPFKDSLGFVDAIVMGDGEEAICEIVAVASRSAGDLDTVKGIAVPSPSGWRETGKRPPLEPLDRIASPYQMGLMPHGQVAFLETYRGCPLTCRFCEWGVSGGARRIFSKEYIARELEAFKAQGAKGMFLLDAGLNLNIHAFRKLRDAEREVQFLRHEGLICDVYPALMGDEYFDFFKEIRRPPYIGVGLQSFSKEVLDLMDRRYDESKFEVMVRKLLDVELPVEIQVIMGLPGDSPKSFLETFERACRLGADVRVFHALVLPDALMTRSLPQFEIQFDPYSLKMISCLGWSEEDFRRVRDFLAERSAAENRTGEARENPDELPGLPYLDPLDRPQGSFYPASPSLRLPG